MPKSKGAGTTAGKPAPAAPEPGRPAGPGKLAAVLAAQPPRPAPRRVAALFSVLAGLYPGHPLDVRGAEPFRVVVAGMLSSRTKDPVTNAAVQRLWARASTPQAVRAIPEDELAALLKPVGFYSVKAKQLHALCEVLQERFAGEVPRTREELMELPGVGRKVANLILNICFDEAAICVDTHVHRIANRLGWVVTDTPEETEQALLRVIDQKHWSVLNRVLVNHGQQVCHPASPKCSVCRIAEYCAGAGVERRR